MKNAIQLWDLFHRFVLLLLQHAELDEKNINELKGMLIKPLNIVNIVQWTVVAVLIVVIIVGIVLTLKLRN